MKVWITKYALEQGIMEDEAQITLNRDAISSWCEPFQMDEYCETKEQAIRKAEKMRIERIKKLNDEIIRIGKEIERLEGLKFE